MAHGPFEIYLIFAALGLGLALPYLLVALFPALANRVPKPGRWMITLRRILAFALAVTAAWLVTVLDTQIGRQGALMSAGFLVGLVAVIGFYRHVSKKAQTLVTSGAIVIALLAILVPPRFAEINANAQSAVSTPWQKFNPAAIDDYVATGKIVFVDVTADWCITCKVNKALVIDTVEIRGRLKQKDVVGMRADWTSPDPIISTFLQRFMRYGIPFNVVFGPNALGGVVLPELLSTNAIIEAFELAKRGRALVKE